MRGRRLLLNRVSLIEYNGGDVVPTGWQGTFYHCHCWRRSSVIVCPPPLSPPRRLVSGRVLHTGVGWWGGGGVGVLPQQCVHVSIYASITHCKPTRQTRQFRLHQHCALSLAAQCIVISPISVCVRLFVCVWVCYHDNSTLHASIFTKLGL